MNIKYKILEKTGFIGAVLYMVPKVAFEIIESVVYDIKKKKLNSTSKIARIGADKRIWESYLCAQDDNKKTGLKDMGVFLR